MFRMEMFPILLEKKHPFSQKQINQTERGSGWVQTETTVVGHNVFVDLCRRILYAFVLANKNIKQILSSNKWVYTAYNFSYIRRLISFEISNATSLPPNKLEFYKQKTLQSTPINWDILGRRVPAHLTPPKFNIGPEKMVVESLLSYWVSVTFQG